MTKNFAGLSSLEQWAKALEDLLAEAQSAVESQNLDAKRQAQKNFLEFIKASPPKCNFLDQIAGRAATNVFESVVDQALAELSARNDELHTVTEAMNGIAEEAQKDARALMFEDTIGALTKVTAVLEAFKELEEQLDTPDAELLGQIAAVASSAADLVAVLGGDSEEDSG